MKRISSVLILSTMISLTAFAADRGSGKVRLESAVKVGASELPAGEYKVTWTGSGDNAQVTLKQGKTMAIATAQVVEVRRNNNAFATKSENGTHVLTEIQFRDTTSVLHDGGNQAAGQ